MSTHSGPIHDVDCLAARTREAPCRCRRRDWLDETVTRAQARHELLTQLANWAREQAVFTRADLDTVKARAELSPYAVDGLRATASIAESVFTRVRLAALHLRDECERPEEAVPVEQTAPRPRVVAAVKSAEPIRTVRAAGERL